MPDELKPCPFCGDKAEIEQMGSGRQSMIWACTMCGCRMESGDTFTSPHDSWNTRATEDALRKQLAEAVGIIRRYSIKDAEDFLARVGEGK